MTNGKHLLFRLACISAACAKPFRHHFTRHRVQLKLTVTEFVIYYNDKCYAHTGSKTLIL